jgi:hypothetical protein
MKLIALVSFLILSASSFAQTCDSSLWNHVYHSYRLAVNRQCTSVTGIVDWIIAEADGDIHIELHQDTQYNYMINSANVSNYAGDLICEIICDTTITQTDAQQPCSGLTNTLYIPNISERVIITGSWVTDNDHGWNEIHPISKIEMENATNVEGLKPEDISINVFPNPSSYFINFSLSNQPNVPVYILLSDEIGRAFGQYQMLRTTNLKIPTANLPGGIYYYTIRQDSGILKTGQFVVSH